MMSWQANRTTDRRERKDHRAENRNQGIANTNCTNFHQFLSEPRGVNGNKAESLGTESWERCYIIRRGLRTNWTFVVQGNEE